MDSWGYVYDGECRLTQVTKNSSDILDNTYDGSGMRVKEVKNGQTTYYIYLGNNPLVEYTANEGKYKYFIYAGTKRIAEEKDGVVRYYHQDHLGSTRLVTDQSGYIVSIQNYEPYGSINNNSPQVTTDFEYTDSPTTKGWIVYDGTGTVSTTYDNQRNSRVLNLTTDDNTGFGVYYAWGSPLWTDGNVKGDCIKLDIKSNDYVVYVEVVDTNGQHWFLTYFSYTSTDRLVGEEYYIFLNQPDDGNWHTICRNLRQDLFTGTGKTLNHIASCCVRGNVALDNLSFYSSQKTVEYGFTGKERDVNSGLSYFGGRWYDSETGRFITADTYTNLPNDERILFGADPNKILSIGFTNSQMYNRYAYCTNNPLRYIDPDGHIIGVDDALEIAAGVALVGEFLATPEGQEITSDAQEMASSASEWAMNNAETAIDLASRAIQSLCFTEDTPVYIKDGVKLITNIKVGDKVYSENPETGEKGLKKVINIFIKETQTLIHIFIGNTEIKATPTNPFWVVGKGWVDAGKLVIGDKLLLYSGKTATISVLKSEQLQKPIKVYNFEVEDWHTYFVSMNYILVHNSCGSISYTITDKISKQMGKRGWTSDSINKTIKKSYTTRKATNKATGNSATAYYNEDGSYVVRDHKTGDIVQVSDRNDKNWARIKLFKILIDLLPKEVTNKDEYY